MHVCSRIVKVVSTKSIVIISSKDRDTLASIKWYQFSGCSVRISSFPRLDLFSYLLSKKKPQKRVRSIHPWSKPVWAFAIFFSLFALLNYRLHRRVELLVLVSSSFRVSSSVHISHATAASLSHPLSTIPSTNFHHVHRTVYCHNHSWGHSHLRLIESASYLVCIGKREKKKIKKKKEKKGKKKKKKREKKRKKKREKKKREKKIGSI